jgi:hypothetical protein
MNEIVKEWIDKAEGDYYSALREYRGIFFKKHGMMLTLSLIV